MPTKFVLGATNNAEYSPGSSICVNESIDKSKTRV